MVFSIRDFYPSKHITEGTVTYLTEFLQRSTLPDFFLGWLVLLFHIAGGLSLVLWLLFAPLNSFYSLIVFTWLGVLASNTYFHGCILSRLERRLFHSEDWHGPVSLANVCFRLLFTDVTKEISNLIIKYCFAVPVSVITVLRLISANNFLSALLLSVCFLPFAFATSQQFVLDELFEWLEHIKIEPWDSIE